MSYPILRAKDCMTDFNYFCSTVTSCGACCFKCRDDLIKAYIDYRTAAQLDGGRFVGIREAREQGLPNVLLPERFVPRPGEPARTLRDFVGDKYGATHDNFIMDTERTTDPIEVERKIRWLSVKAQGLADPRWREEAYETWFDDFNNLDCFTEKGAHADHLKSRLWMVCFGRYTVKDLSEGRNFSNYLLEYCQNLPSRPASEAVGCLCLDRNWKTSEVVISDNISQIMIGEHKHKLDDMATKAVCLALENVDKPILEILLSHYSGMQRPIHTWLQVPSLIENFRRIWLSRPIIRALGDLRRVGKVDREAAIREIDVDLQRLERLAEDLRIAHQSASGNTNQ